MNVVLCDSEKKSRTIYRPKIEAFAKEKNITINILEYKNVHNLYYDFTDGILKADVIIIDINLCGDNCIETVMKLREAEYRNEIIVLTASEEQNDILSGYDIEALYYVIKNKTGDNKLNKLFHKAVNRVSNRTKEVITFSCAGENRTIPIRDILYFEIVHRIVTVHYGTDSKFLFYTPLEQIEETLCGKGFVRNYRSQIVSIRKIKSYTFERIILDNGIELPVGRSHSKDVRDAVKRWLSKKVSSRA